MRYHPFILDALAAHGLRPTATMAPERLREIVSALYNYELRRLRDRVRGGSLPIAQLAEEVTTLRKRYPVLSVPLDNWGDDSR